MSSITKKTKQGVQPLAADDGILADSTSDGESPGVSEGDGPLRQADEAERFTTISGDGPEILRATYSYMQVFCAGFARSFAQEREVARVCVCV